MEAKDSIPAGTKINVTFLGNEDLEMRVAAAKAVRELGFVPVPHISARRLASRAQLEEFLSRLQDVGATEQRLRRRRRPDHAGGSVRGLVRRDPHRTAPGLRRERGLDRRATPRVTPTSRTRCSGARSTRSRCRSSQQGLDATILTQFAFDTDPVLAWIDEVRERGIDSTIRIGTPGPAGIKRLLGFARRFGIGANAMIVKKYGFSLTNLMGTAGPDKFVTDLSAMLAETRRRGARGRDDRPREAPLLHVRRPPRDRRLGP